MLHMFIILLLTFQFSVCFFFRDNIDTTPFLHLRYEGTNCALMITPVNKQADDGGQHGDFEAAFILKCVKY